MPSRMATYDRSVGQSLAPRDVEAAAFIFVNRMLQQAQGTRDRITALDRNHRLWSLLLTDVGLTSNRLPPILKKDLVTIGAWSMSFSIAAMSSDVSVKPLIAVNADMVEALRPDVPKDAVPAAVLAPRHMPIAVAV